MNATVKPLPNGDFHVEGRGMADGREGSPYELGPVDALVLGPERLERVAASDLTFTDELRASPDWQMKL